MAERMSGDPGDMVYMWMGINILVRDSFSSTFRSRSIRALIIFTFFFISDRSEWFWMPIV